MIVSRIDGGLGNQLFQYAYGWYTSQQQGTELVLDLSAYDDQPEHGYLLDQLQIEGRVLSNEECGRVPPKYLSRANRPPLARRLMEWADAQARNDGFAARTYQRETLWI